MFWKLRKRYFNVLIIVILCYVEIINSSQIEAATAV